MNTWKRVGLFVALLSTLCATAFGQLTAEQWQADIKMLGENLRGRHPDFFTSLTAEEFEDAIDALSAQLATLDDQQIVMEISRVVAMGGDAHTNVGFNAVAKAMHKLPIQCIVLADGLFISAADKRYEDLVGAQVVRFGETDALEAINLAGALFAHENKWKLINGGSSFVTILPALAAVGIAPEYDADSFTITVKDEEGKRTVDLDCTVPTTRRRWVSFVEFFDGEMPMAYKKSRGLYQSEFIADHKTMYVAYNKCQDAEDFSFKLFTQFIMEKSEELDARRIVIDLRINGGGNERVLWTMIDALKESSRFRDHGDIIALTSRYTFSSAMSNAQQLRDRVGAVLIGEPTGGKPNHFGEVRSFELPNSKLMIFHSTKYFRKVEGDPDAVYPDVRIEVGAEDFFAGNDPVLDAALGYEAAGESD